MPYSSERIPVIDLTDFYSAKPGALVHLAEAIRVACRSTGVFYVINHRVSTMVQKTLFSETSAIFDLSPGEKETMNINRSKHMRGYFGYGADKSDGINGDLKEGFDLGWELPDTDPLVKEDRPFYGPNVWPHSLPNFRHNITDYYNRMFRLGLDLLRAIGVGLDIGETYFQKYFSKPIAQLRLLRYPYRDSHSAETIGAGEHTDFGCLTIILQDQVDGLEIRNPNGEWIGVPAIRDALVVNIGDLMQRWTNDEYLATVHRVVNRASSVRHSIAFFMDPDADTIIECIPSFVSAAKPPRYPPMAFGDYINLRYLQTTEFSSGHST